MISNVKDICKEIIWYSSKNENGRYRIPIALDFDYTCTKKSSWLDGTWVENPFCFETLKKWSNLGCVFILDTMRGEKNIQPAIEWLTDNGIELYGINHNPDQGFTNDCSNKVWAVFSIDDRNVGTFLIRERDERPYIDWVAMDANLTPILEEVYKELPKLEQEVIDLKNKVYAK